jgi:antitoxin component HigA of HigAB toxin-antitoxin module
MTLSNYSKIERGEILLTINHAMKLAKFYKISLDALLNSASYISPDEYDQEMMQLALVLNKVENDPSNGFNELLRYEIEKAKKNDVKK